MANGFIAVDVETANGDLSSICQIGAVTFEGGHVTSQWQSLVDPEDYFDGWNESIHGITKEMVVGAPTFKALAAKIDLLLRGRIVISHTPFDRLALTRAAEKYGLSLIPCTWLDSAKVVRRAWPQFRESGWALKKVTKSLGITFKHHMAVEDARAAGEIVVRAIADTGIPIEDWLLRARRPATSPRLARDGNPDGSLAGEVVAFTGALTIPRRQAAEMAAAAGCDVSDGVTAKTTLLVVGEQDIRRLTGHTKSSKHRKAEALVGKGQEIRILSESDFRRLVEGEYGCQNS